MRVEAAPHVYHFEDRRQRADDRRAPEQEFQTAFEKQANRARHEAHLWFAPTFGAHILGQSKPAQVSASEARRAYQQPEARTPLRPQTVTRA